ncbi:Cadmium, cobalt and zinc/H(+)-K(+) antiporter [freshwater sediment metagenome]|uniref:Cadmium, cobalt and zinc/H(+)-K(+) antiporter n=1 Tax=freshwater sediment metagenome TaxID=556182 RepID=A0AA48M1K5_9ZZZZ
MTHAHHHDHHHAPKRFGVAFAVGAALNLGLVIAEVTFGFLSNSVALVSDGVHNLSDVLGLLLAWAGSWLATRQPSDRRTYGYRRASILAALANAALLLTATGGLIVEAVQRLFDAQPIASGMVLWVASVAIAVNLGTALLFMRGRESDINIRGAFLHLMADAAVSLGVVIAALLISKTGWLWLDPVASLGVALVVLASGWGLMRSALDLALDAVPPGVDRSAVEDYLAGLPGVTEVHDLHIWGMSTTETALTAHLVRPGALPDDALLDQIAQELERQFHIHHVTIQLENGALACRYAPAHVV